MTDTDKGNKCKAGYFCDGLSPASHNKDGEKCSIGYYCPAGGGQERPWPVGTIGPQSGLGNVNKCEDCEAG